MPEPIHVDHITDIPGQPGLGEHIANMRPEVVRNLVAQTGLGESEAMIKVQDEFYGFITGAGVDKVMVEAAFCERCNKPMTQMTVESLVGPKGFNEDEEHQGRMHGKREREFPFIMPRAVVENGAHCDCGGVLIFSTRDLTTEENW